MTFSSFVTSFKIDRQCLLKVSFYTMTDDELFYYVLNVNFFNVLKRFNA